MQKIDANTANSMSFTQSAPVQGQSSTLSTLAAIELQLCSVDEIAALSPWAARYYAEDQIDFHPARFASALTTVIQQQRGSAFWLTQAQTKVGYAIVLDGWSIEYGGLTVELDEFFVAPEHRNQGAGAQAIALLKSWCAARGAVFMGMETTPDNIPAQKLYQRLGFAATGRPVFRWFF
jgi:ribosomal protein S18 acetylase RimI-like enzyme